MQPRDFDFRPFFADYKARWSNRETRHEVQHVVVLSMRGRLVECQLAYSQWLRVWRKGSSVIIGRVRDGLARVVRPKPAATAA